MPLYCEYCRKSYWSLSKEAHFKVWHREKAAPTVTQDVVQKIETHHTKDGKKKKCTRGPKRKLAKPRKKQRIRKRPKKIKEENEDEPMAEALPPLDYAELMNLVQASARSTPILACGLESAFL